jgi:hypothetical protein
MQDENARESWCNLGNFCWYQPISSTSFSRAPGDTLTMYMRGGRGREGERGGAGQ